MKTKITTLFALTILLSLFVVSAATSFTLNTNSLAINEPNATKTFVITPTNPNSSFIVDTPTILDKNGVAIPIAVSGSLTSISGAETITLTFSLDYNDLIVDGTYQGNVVIKDASNTTDSEIIQVILQSTFCDNGEQGKDLDISDVNFDNDDGDDEEWTPLDEITVEVEVSNDGDDRIKDVVVEIGLFNSKGKNIVNDLEDLNDEKIDLGSIRDGDEDTATFIFKVPADFEDDTYAFVVKAYSDDDGENLVCTSSSTDLSDVFFQSIDGERETDEDKHIIVDTIKVSPDTAMCNEIVQVSAEVFNIGDEDYQDQVLITMVNTELGVNLERIIRNDFDQGDSADIEFDFRIPSDANEKTYLFEFRTYYDYNDKRDLYELISEDKFTNFDNPLRVEGNCLPGGSFGGAGSSSGSGETVVGSAQISAQLSSQTPQAIPGKQVIIRASIANLGSTTNAYAISILGNTAWSNLVSIDPRALTIVSGASQETNIVLNVDEGASGTQEFTIRVTDGNGRINDQRIAIPIESDDSVDVNTDAIGDHIRENWFIYLIVLINVILIIAIISVVRRMVAPERV
jgi:hypothetical protein